MENQYYPYVNLPLPYPYHAMEPWIDEKTMMLHHDRHLQTYVDNLNRVLEGQPELQRLSLEQLIRCGPDLPESVRDGVRNNAGGVYNHRFYFKLLQNPEEEGPVGKLGQAIQRDFGSGLRFREQFKKAALSVFGSGYAWLVLDRGRLKIVTMPNQSCPLEMGMAPVLTVDVWEHAYYLKHYNVRAAYLDDWFRVVSWEQAEQNFLAGMLP